MVNKSPVIYVSLFNRKARAKDRKEEAGIFSALFTIDHSRFPIDD
jgi:hypothetical protein